MHAEQQAQIDNLTLDVRNLTSEQRQAESWRTEQSELNRRLMTDTQASRRASEKASEAAIKSVTIIERMDKKWDRRHEELSGRVAVLEDKVDTLGPPPAMSPPAAPPPRQPSHPIIPSVLPDLLDMDDLSEKTKTDLLAADKEGVLSAFLNERELTSKLRADVAAMQARLDERQRHSDRAREDAELTRLDRKDNSLLRLHWGKLLLGTVATIIVSGGGALAIFEQFLRH